MFKFRLNEIVKDIITGFVGVVVGRTEYLTGCIHYGILSQTLTKEGKVREWEWIDETRLKSTGKILNDAGTVLTIPKSKKNGGPSQNAPEM